MTDVLITPANSRTFLTKEPRVVIDTRNPEAYAAGHHPRRRQRPRDLHLSRDLDAGRHARS